MKFIWNEPKPTFTFINKDYSIPYPPIFWEHAIIGWLESNRVFLGKKNSKDYAIDYNYVYHFFDIYVYDQEKNGDPIATFRDYLSTTDLDWKESYTIRWEDDEDDNRVKQIKGSRFWVQAEDFPNAKRYK